MCRGKDKKKSISIELSRWDVGMDRRDRDRRTNQPTQNIHCRKRLTKKEREREKKEKLRRRGKGEKKPSPVFEPSFIHRQWKHSERKREQFKTR